MGDASTAGIEELLTTSRGLLGIVARSLAPALEHVTVPQFRLIVLTVTLGPTRSVDLAERLAVSTSTLTRNVDRLVTGGWVERRTSASSRREVLVAATDRGAALVADVSDRRRRELQTVLDRVPDEHRAAVVEAAVLLRTAMDEPAPESLAVFGG